MTARRASCVLAVIVALLAAGFGLEWRLEGIGRADPAIWRQRVAAVAHAPIPSGSRVSLVPPPSGEVFPKAYRYEAAWLRPDLLWQGEVTWPPQSMNEWAAVIGRPAGDPGWTVVWSEVEVTVLRRTP